MPFALTMPKLSPTMEHGTIVKWHKSVGEYVEVGDVLLEVATDKATVEHGALDAGWLKKILQPEGEDVAINEPIAVMSEEEDESIEGFNLEGHAISENIQNETVATKKDVSPPQRLSFSESSGRILASPLAKKIAREKGIDLSRVQGSGPGGRIMKKDLEHVSTAAVEAHAAQHSQAIAGAAEEIPLTPMRKVIAERLQEAKSTIPHFYATQLIDARPLIALREQLKKSGCRVTFNDLILKGCAKALKEHPEINCGFNPASKALIAFKTIDISVAVSIEGGLITPIVWGADRKSIMEISEEVKRLSQKAKEGKLQPNEFTGGSFTISNMGMYGISSFQAIINPPQGAILAVSGISDAAIVEDGVVVAGKQLSLSLSVDHRIIDGVAAVMYLKTLQKLLEDPIVILV